MKRLKGEDRPVNALEDRAAVIAGQSTGFETNDDFDFHTVTAKLSYRFN